MWTYIEACPLKRSTTKRPPSLPRGPLQLRETNMLPSFPDPLRSGCGVHWCHGNPVPLFTLHPPTPLTPAPSSYRHPTRSSNVFHRRQQPLSSSCSHLLSLIKPSNPKEPELSHAELPYFLPHNPSHFEHATVIYGGVGLR